MGYHAWMQKNNRSTSREVSFGKWWVMEGALWQVAWLRQTEELYAAQPASDRFFVIGRFPQKEISTLMRQWFDGDNLSALVERLNQKKAN